MNIGLFGGTFDPIHLGHLRTIREVSEQFDLSKTLIAPAAIPPHKPFQDITAASHRLEMIRLAIGKIPEFEVSDIELIRSGPSYTIDTVKHCLAAADPNDRLHLVMGLDAFLEIDTWKSFRELFRLVPIVVMNRPGNRGYGSTIAWKAAENFIKETLSKQYGKTASGKSFEHVEYQPIHLADVSPLDISGTRIRHLVRQKRSIQFLVPERVEHYILQRGLYT